jgi:hypothetical protein
MRKWIFQFGFVWRENDNGVSVAPGTSLERVAQPVLRSAYLKPMRRLGGSGGGRSSGCSFVQMVRNAEGQWEDCRGNYIAACRAACAALRFREAFEDGGVGGKLFPHPEEGAHHKDAHGDGFGAVEHGGGHDGAVFSEGVGQLSTTTVGTGHKL